MRTKSLRITVKRFLEMHAKTICSPESAGNDRGASAAKFLLQGRFDHDDLCAIIALYVVRECVAMQALSAISERANDCDSESFESLGDIADSAIKQLEGDLAWLKK